MGAWLVSTTRCSVALCSACVLLCNMPAFSNAPTVGHKASLGFLLTEGNWQEPSGALTTRFQDKVTYSARLEPVTKKVILSRSDRAACSIITPKE